MYKWEVTHWLKSHSELFVDNYILRQDAKLYAEITKFIEDEQILAPKIIYINGFGNEDVSSLFEYVQKNAFVGLGGQCIILDEHNCQIPANSKLQCAYQAGEYEFLGHYFALKAIVETGGFYIGKSIRITSSLDYILNSTAFFSYITPDTLSSEVWGGMPNAPILHGVLNTYSDPIFFGDGYTGIADRFKNILISCYRFSFNGRSISNKHFFIADSRLCVKNINGSTFICEHDFTQFIDRSDYHVWPDNLAVTDSYTDRRLINTTKDFKRLQAEVEEIKNSDSYKLVKHLKKWGNTAIGTIFKKIFKFLLKKYRKYKYHI